MIHTPLLQKGRNSRTQPLNNHIKHFRLFVFIYYRSCGFLFLTQNTQEQKGENALSAPLYRVKLLIRVCFIFCIFLAFSLKRVQNTQAQ